MTGPDVSQLPPGDAVVALRSYPRRFRAVLGPLPDDPDGVDALALRAGPDGHSALDLLVDAVRTLGVAGRALHQIVYTDDPVLHPGVMDPAARHWEQAIVGGVADALTELDDDATELADAAGKLGGRDWRRTGSVAGSAATVTALDVLREAVRTVADDLHRAEAAMAASRR